MDFRGWVPPEIAIGLGLIALLGGSWVLFGLWWLSQHITVGWG
jgi:hypothetical protein